MKKELLLATMLTFASSSLLAGTCEDGFKMDFNFFGAPDKSYSVLENTFTSMKPSFPNGKLSGATVEIDLLSVSTAANKYGEGSAKWPAAMVPVRDNNTKNGFFKQFESGNTKGMAKIVAVKADSVDVEITMNGKTEKITMATKVEGDVLKASGKLDVSKFSSKGWKSFEGLCRGFHKGKSWGEVDLFFSVPASCK